MSIIINGQSGIDMGGKPLSNETSIHEAVSKTTPVDADEIGILDSASSFGLKKLTWVNLKNTLGSLFAPLYSPLFTGNVGIDTSSPSYKLEATGGIGLVVGSGTDSPNSGKGIWTIKDKNTYNGFTWQLGTSNSANLLVGSGSSWAERMRITSSGNLLVGTTIDNGVDKLQVSGGISTSLANGSIIAYGGFTPVINSTSSSYAGYASPTANISDLNDLNVAGIYNGDGLMNSPVGGWVFVQHMRHSNTSENNWAQQILTTMGAGNYPNQMYIRTKVGGTWTNWSRIY